MLKWSGALRHYLAWLLAMMLLITVVLFFLYQRTLEAETDRLRAEEQQAVLTTSAPLSRQFEPLVSDLMVVANMAEGHLAGGAADNWQSLAQQLREFSDLKRIYDQIRFIDAAGMERLRINLRQEKAAIASPSKLQNKQQRYYFDKAMALKPGEIYISPLDLNIEHGRIETPFKPVIRFATPLSDATGHKAGIVVLNYLGNDLLEHFIAAHATTPGEISLLNRDGYWLHADSPELEWGFMFKDKQQLTFANRFPAVWRQMVKAGSGQIENAQGIFTFRTIFPVREAAHVIRKTARHPELLSHPKQAAEYRWVVVSQLHPQTIAAVERRVLHTHLLYLLLLTIVAAAIAWFMTSRERLKEEAGRNLLKATIQEGALDAIVSFHDDGTIIDFNPAAERMFGIDHEQAIGSNFYDMVVRIDGENLHAGTIARQTGHQRGECLRSDGARMPARFGLTRITHGRQPFYTCFIQDLSKQEKIKKALQESEEHYRAIFDTAAEAIVLIDTATGRIIEFNDQACRYFGYSRQELPQMSIADIEYSESPKEASSHIGGIVSRGHDTFETRYRTKSGGIRDAIVSATCLGIGDCNTITSIWTDITEQKQAGDRLRESEARFRLLLDSTAEGIYGLDLNGNCTMINRAALQMLGYEEADLLGQDMHTIIHHTRADGAPYPREKCRGYEAYRHGRQVHVADECFWRKDGSSFPVEYHAHPIRNNGELAGAVVTFIDITERLSLEESFRQAQKMEAVGILVGGIAHEFNNLLAGITGNAYMAKDHLNEPEKIAHYLDEVDELGFKAADIIKQMLAFARKSITELNSFDLKAMIYGSMRLLRLAVPEHIRLQHVPSREPLAVRGDAKQLQQVLLNLISNAGDAIDGKQDGIITIRLARVQADDELARRHPQLAGRTLARLSVEDNGGGIPPDQLDKIFDPFYTTKEVGEGTGLGLAMAYGAIEGHRGAIDVENRPGEGTAFHIYLPLHETGEGKHRVVKHPSHEVVKGHGETVLVVDDDEVVRTIALKLLEKIGYKTLAATDGVEAVEMFKAHQANVDAVLMDVVMPNMGGVEAAGRILRIKPEAKIIFTTGHDKEETIDDMPDIKEMLMLRKPYPVGELSGMLQRLLRKKGRGKNHKGTKHAEGGK